MFPVHKTSCIPFDTNDASSNGESLDRVEMADGSLADPERSECPKGTKSVFRFAKTCIRYAAFKEGILTEMDMERRFRDKAWMLCQMEAFERKNVTGGERRNEASRRVEALQRNGCEKSSNGASAYLAFKLWDSASDAFAKRFNRKRVVSAKPCVHTGAALKNWPSVHMALPSFRPTKCPPPLTVLPACSQVNHEKICEVEIEGHGLVQIFQEAGWFEGKIVERTKHFSKTSTVPLYCEGLRDPKEATRNLMYLPQSALRRRIHILSDRARGVDRFIFVGKLGLRGGGNGEASSSSDAHGYQTAAEDTVSRSVIRGTFTRTNSSIIRKILVGRRYHCLEEVVNGYNEADDVQERNGLAMVMRKVLSAFHGMPVREVTDNRGAAVREYLLLCRLKGTGDKHLLLLRDFFDSLRDKLCNDALHSRYLIEAVEHALQNVDNEIFEDNPNSLLQLSQFVIDEFNPQRMCFSREMFPVQCSALHVVHQCLRILFDIGSNGWDPNKPDGLYAKFKDWSQGVIDAAEHYPAKYQAMLVQQSLSFLQSSKRGVRIANNARRIANLVYGTVGVCQAVRNAVLLDFDLGNVESTASALARARENRIVREEQWYKCLYALDTVRFAAIEDPSAFGQFSELLSSLVLEEEGSTCEQCKVLRFGVVEMLTSLAIHGKDDIVRRESAASLADLVEPRDRWDWLSDADLFLEMLDNLAELSARGREPEKQIAREAIEKLASTVHDGLCEGLLSKWLGGKTVKERIQSVMSVRSEKTGNELFTQVWKSLEGELSRASTEVRSPAKNHHYLFSPLIVRHFAGRESEYTELIKAFESSTEPVVVKAVVGPGGIGKSQLAAKVFEHLKNTSSYANDFWIPSDSTEGLQAAFLQIADYLELRTDVEIPKVVRSVHEELRKSRSLFVFDNAPDLKSIREYLPFVNGHVIVTTRDSGARDWLRDMVRLDPFNKIEAQDLAEKYGFGDKTHVKDLEELFDALPQYPLALTQFFSMMTDKKPSSPAEWLNEVQKYNPSRREADIMKKLSAEKDSAEARGMVFVFNSSAQKISEEPDDLGPSSLDLFSKLVLLDPNGVPIEWVYKWLGSEDEQSRTTTKGSVRLLERFSYVSWDRENNKIFIHAETQLLARHLLLDIGETVSETNEASEEQTNRKLTDHVRVIVHSIDEYVSNWRTDRSNRDLWTSLAQNLSALLKHSENCTDLDVQLKLTGYMSTAYAKMCMFTKSLSYSQKALEICERLHKNVDHQELVDCIKRYSVGLSKVGRDKEALPFDKRALEMCQRLHSEAGHQDIVECITNYANGLARARRDIEALPLLRNAFEMCLRLGDAVDQDLLIHCIRNYAVGLSKVGREIEALEFRQKALRMCEERHKGADHPDLVDCIRTYAVGLSKLISHKKALSFYKTALEMCKRLQNDEDHPDLVECIRSYSDGLLSVGRYDEALPLHRKALEMCERLHDDTDHPALVECYINYANGLDRAGRDDEAVPFFLKALEMCKRFYGDTDHPALVECYINYANGLASARRYDKAVPFFLKALKMCERLHGDTDHPALVECYINYANGLASARRDDEAVSFFLKALKMCERLHGDTDHPTLVKCYINCANGIDRARRYDKAVPLFLKALEMCERLLGEARDSHFDAYYLMIDIIQYANQLASWRRDDDEAVPLFLKVLEMCERLLGDARNSDSVKDFMKNVHIDKMVRRREEALPLGKKALEICERLYGDADDPDLVKCYAQYASGLASARRDDEAVPLFLKALEMCERLLGDARNSDSVKRFMNYVHMDKMVRRREEALPLGKKALEICERLYGDADHPALVKCYAQYASGLASARRDDEAVPFFLKALEMCERLHGDMDHPALVECYAQYASGLASARRDDEAVPFFLKALEMCERLHGDMDHPALVECYINYANGLSGAGRFDDEALTVYKRAIEMCERIHGDADHPDLFRCIQNYANGLSGAGRFDDEALTVYKRAIEMCERIHGDADHPDLFRCIQNYAAGLSGAGRYFKAWIFARKAEKIRKRLFSK